MECTDILLVLKKDKPLTDKQIWDDLNLNYHLSKWDNDKVMFVRDPKRDTIKLSQYDFDPEQWIYDGRSFHSITKCEDRIKYAYASMHEDSIVTKIITDKIKEVNNVKITNQKFTMKPYLKQWMEKYNFTLEEFIFNDKFIVLSDNQYNHQIYTLADAGLIKWENIEICSAWPFNDGYVILN